MLWYKQSGYRASDDETDDGGERRREWQALRLHMARVNEKERLELEAYRKARWQESMVRAVAMGILAFVAIFAVIGLFLSIAVLVT